MRNIVIAGWALVLASLVALLAIGSQSDAQYDELDWAVIECEQGNVDACQLEKNLLIEKE